MRWFIFFFKEVLPHNKYYGIAETEYPDDPLTHQKYFDAWSGLMSDVFTGVLTSKRRAMDLIEDGVVQHRFPGFKKTKIDDSITLMPVNGELAYYPEMVFGGSDSEEYFTTMKSFNLSYTRKRKLR